MRYAREDVKKMTDNHHLANKWTIFSWFLLLLSKNSSEVSAFQKNWHSSVWMAKSYRKCTKLSSALLISPVHFPVKYIIINLCHDTKFIQSLYLLWFTMLFNVRKEIYFKIKHCSLSYVMIPCFMIKYCIFFYYINSFISITLSCISSFYFRG